MLSLGPRTVIGKLDATGNNAGNWTVVFGPDVFNIDVPFECYHIVVNGAPGTTFFVYIENNVWDYVASGDINSWDPEQVMPIIPGQTVYFYYSDSVNDLQPPVVTMWLRSATGGN